LHTRYTLDGDPGSDDWPNFQLDGFGTLLWGWYNHLERTNKPVLPPLWASAAGLLVRYLAALWEKPNYDCWEEFPDHIAVSTLASLYAGLHAIGTIPGLDPYHAQLATVTAEQIKHFVLARGMYSGHLIKQIDGEDAVDANLLWASVPFGVHGLFQPEEALMAATALRIESDLIGGTGGVHRYRADTYYGGGEWILLTALLGQYRAARGDTQGAQACLEYVTSHADENGNLPEQWTTAPLTPDGVAVWVQRWGPVAKPLLWSHATYLNLYAVLQPFP
jgi:GH15 family glucan-1,4-alpha-glucosidase